MLTEKVIKKITVFNEKCTVSILYLLLYTLYEHLSLKPNILTLKQNSKGRQYSK